MFCTLSRELLEGLFIIAAEVKLGRETPDPETRQERLQVIEETAGRLADAVRAHQCAIIATLQKKGVSIPTYASRGRSLSPDRDA